MVARVTTTRNSFERGLDIFPWGIGTILGTVLLWSKIVLDGLSAITMALCLRSHKFSNQFIS